MQRNGMWHTDFGTYVFRSKELDSNDKTCERTHLMSEQYSPQELNATENK